MLTPSLLTIPALEEGNSKRSQPYCSKQHGKQKSHLRTISVWMHMSENGVIIINEQ